MSWFKFDYVSRYDKVDPCLKSHHVFIKLWRLHAHFSWERPYSKQTRQWLDNLPDQTHKGEW